MLSKSLYIVENKIVRYYNLLRLVHNWPAYFLRKMTGFGDRFRFRLRNFQDLDVPREVIGTFRECYFDQIYFRYIPSETLKHVSEPFIVDIGGHVGHFAISALARYPQAKVHSLEPHPANFRALQDKERLLRAYQFRAYQLAVSDRNEPLELSTPSLDLHTTLSTVAEGAEGHQAVTVEAVRLDTFMQNQEIDWIDFLKVDCEGAEYDILYGLPKPFYQKIGAMCIETHEELKSDRKSSALAEHIRKMGYQVKHRKINATGYIWAWKPVDKA